MYLTVCLKYCKYSVRHQTIRRRGGAVGLSVCPQSKGWVFKSKQYVDQDLVRIIKRKFRYPTLMADLRMKGSCNQDSLTRESGSSGSCLSWNM